MAEQLKVKCKQCGIEFLSPIQFDRGGFSTATLSDNSFPCPRGHDGTYSKGDMFFD